MNRFLPVPWLVLALMLASCGGGSGTAEPATAISPVESATDPQPPAEAEPAPVVPAPAPPPPIEPAPAPIPEPTPEPAPPAEPEPTGPGRLESAALINRVTAAEVTQAIVTATAAGERVPQVSPVYEVANHRITYLTIDGQGRSIVASGLLSVPLKANGAASPVLGYQHGTTFKDAEAPSNHAVGWEPSVVMASLGYIVVAPDYVGYGASRGAQHPYLMAAPSASAVLDLLTAARTWRQRNQVADNGQLFLAGYSEGGYVTLAAHRAMQAGNSAHLANLVATVPGAGPYHVGVTMDELLRRVKDEHPILGALLSPGLLKNLGSTVRDEVRRLLVRLVVPDDADVTIQTNFVDNYLADDEAAIEQQSNVHDWTPAAPVALFHGPGDQTVPYASSARTLQTMQARAAPGVSLADCTATPNDHLPCVLPYWAFLFERLAPLARNL